MNAPRMRPAGGGLLKPAIMRGALSMLSPAGPSARLSLLLFHKVPTLADPLASSELNLERFEHMLDVVAANANVLPLSEASAALKRGTLPARAVALTFDDGYAEWIDNVAPALLRRKLPATFFVTTGHIEGGVLWHERILAAVRALPAHGAHLPKVLGPYPDLDAPGCRERLVERLQAHLKYAPLGQRLDAIEQLESQACRPLILPPGFDAASVRTLHGQGFEIGAHTVHHPILNECTAAQARAEIGDCKAQLEAIIGGAVHSFAYPNGRPNQDFHRDHVQMVKAAGYHTAVTTSIGVASAATDPLQLPRFTPWGLSEERITFQLARNMLTKPTPLTPSRRTAAANGADADAHAGTDLRCLMVASVFAPIHGGSAVVYENLCRHMPPGSIRVLTASTNYHTREDIPGWREHDARQNFPVDRIRLLRPASMPPPANKLVSLWRMLTCDLPLYAKVLYKAAQLVRKHDINLVCIGELVTGSWLGIALKKMFGCKLIIYVHGEEITTRTDGRLGQKRKQFLMAADRIVSVSSFTCDAMRTLGVPSESMVLIQNGVDIDYFTPGERDPELVARHGLQGKQIVLTVGRLVARKGADMAVRAMKQVVARRPGVHYLIVGDGELRPELERLIAAEGLERSVTLVGKVSDADLLRYLRLCDLFLMPNRTLPDGDTEGFGLVFREANACRKPVIGGRAGGVVEAVEDGVSGLLVDGTQPDQIAAAVERILGDPALAQQLSEGGLALARRHSTAAVASQFLRTCERLLGVRG
ncbi:glycosyltransferase [Massilia forsythiae]|uniref:Glycosyltransferase n=1 Tax=Massilia forsythiae TaxID=2728020 RepID=A0A7Z2ZTD9_9BURK|nr:glycosyltransferase [Massilia forsythiae]QJD99891.1 glycosyltransferase [Massilia forsythiae]